MAANGLRNASCAMKPRPPSRGLESPSHPGVVMAGTGRRWQRASLVIDLSRTDGRLLKKSIGCPKLTSWSRICGTVVGNHQAEVWLCLGQQRLDCIRQVRGAVVDGKADRHEGQLDRHPDTLIRRRYPPRELVMSNLLLNQGSGSTQARPSPRRSRPASNSWSATSTRAKMSHGSFMRLRNSLFDKLEQARKAQAEDEARDVPRALAEHLAEHWPELEVHTQRRVIRAVAKAIVISKATSHGPVDPGRVSVEWRV